MSDEGEPNLAGVRRGFPVSDKVASVKRAARVALGRLTENADIMAVQLEQEGWKYDPPKPVLPVVSDDAIRAQDLAYVARFSGRDGLRAAFKVILKENIGRVGNGFYANSREFYRIITGEEWT